MYILKNAFKNIFQNAGRNLMIAVIFLLVITMSCVAIIVRDNTATIANDYKSQLSTQVFIEQDYQKVSQAMERNDSFLIPGISNDTVRKMAQSKYIKKVEYAATMEAVADQLKFKQPVDKRYTELQRAGEPLERARIPSIYINGDRKSVV